MERRPLGQRGDDLGTLQLDKGRGCGKVFLLLGAQGEHLHLGRLDWGRGLGPMNGAWQAVMLRLRLVGIRNLGRGSLAGEFSVAGVLCLFVRRRLAQCQGLFGQKVER